MKSRLSFMIHIWFLKLYLYFLPLSSFYFFSFSFFFYFLFFRLFFPFSCLQKSVPAYKWRLHACKHCQALQCVTVCIIPFVFLLSCYDELVWTKRVAELIHNHQNAFLLFSPVLMRTVHNLPLSWSYEMTKTVLRTSDLSALDWKREGWRRSYFLFTQEFQHHKKF